MGEMQPLQRWIQAGVLWALRLPTLHHCLPGADRGGAQLRQGLGNAVHGVSLGNRGHEGEGKGLRAKRPRVGRASFQNDPPGQTLRLLEALMVLL